jgi:hypothetical protein
MQQVSIILVLMSLSKGALVVLLFVLQLLLLLYHVLAQLSNAI